MLPLLDDESVIALLQANGADLISPILALEQSLAAQTLLQQGLTVRLVKSAAAQNQRERSEARAHKIQVVLVIDFNGEPMVTGSFGGGSGAIFESPSTFNEQRSGYLSR